MSHSPHVENNTTDKTSIYDPVLFNNGYGTNGDNSSQIQFANGSSDEVESSSSVVGVSSVSEEREMDQLTIFSLRLCQGQVVSHYNKLLVLIGWRSFTKAIFTPYVRFWKILNCIYLGLITLLLLYSYAYDALSDNGKYLHRVSMKPPMGSLVANNTLIRLADPHSNASKSFPSVPIRKYPPCFNSSLRIVRDPEKCADVSRLLTAYVVPSLIHFVAFVYGLVHFRVRENEQLDVVMEKVFLRAQSTFGVQRRLVFVSRWYLTVSFLWVMMILATCGITFYAFGYPVFAKQWLSILLVGLQCCGKLLVSCIYVAIVVNYATQCEFFVYSIRGLCLQLQDKTLHLSEATKEILTMKELLSLLNGPLSKMTSLCVLNFAILTALSIHSLTANLDGTVFIWLTYVLFPCLWIPMMLFPLVQAARVTKEGERLTQTAYQMRVYGYKESSEAQLDSFIIFAAGARLRSKLYSVPVKPAYLMSSIALIVFVLVIIYQ